MLRLAIEACPESLWNRETDHNPFWVLAYHSVFFAHLYLSAAEETFEPFERDPAERAGFGRTHLGNWTKLGPADAYARDDVLAYCRHVESLVSDLVNSAPFDTPSGFHWLQFPSGEAHLYNLRHIQHHAGQLIGRVRQVTGTGTARIFAAR
jgi:hypothetical protein